MTDVPDSHTRNGPAESHAAEAIRLDGISEDCVLQELRKTRGLSQRTVAKLMHVSQPRVHEIEHHDIGRTGVDVIRAYIAALGGEMEITARIEGKTYHIA